MYPGTLERGRVQAQQAPVGIQGLGFRVWDPGGEFSVVGANER